MLIVRYEIISHERPDDIPLSIARPCRHGRALTLPTQSRERTRLALMEVAVALYGGLWQVARIVTRRLSSQRCQGASRHTLRLMLLSPHKTAPRIHLRETQPDRSRETMPRKTTCRHSNSGSQAGRATRGSPKSFAKQNSGE